jgi:DNA repair photolyase
MRWSGQEIAVEQPETLPGLARLSNLVRSVRTPEFAGITFHEVLAKSALNKIPGGGGALPFGWTINPFRGCSHACAYCLGPETLILMADGRQQPLWSVRVGDAIMGTEVRGQYRRYVPTTVLASWNTVKRGYRITLADGTELVASGDHRFLTERGWKYVTGAMSGQDQRPYLTTNNKLAGFGLNGLTELVQPQVFERSYRRGYLTGMIRGDGMMLSKDYPRRGGGIHRARHFRLALADVEALNRSRSFLDQEGISTQTRPFAVASATRRPILAIHTNRIDHHERITGLILWPEIPDLNWHAGFLSGVFDAEGSCSRGVLRIWNKDESILDNIQRSMRALGIDHVLEPARPNGVRCVRVSGGLPMRARFFALTGPAISRKLDIAGMAVKSDAKLQVVSVEDLGAEIDLIDITTGTGDFIANGVISHNCFARPTHKYLDLDIGKDFDNEIIVKVNVAEVLAKELAKPSWERHPVALGTNTDPYQRAEGRYSLMPGIIDALASSGTPFSILTKGTLLRRDLDLLADAAKRVPVDLAMSIAIYDDELQQSVEPGTPSTKARLATVTAVREHGLDCAVFMMPILPYLTDTRAHLDEALRQAKAAGATSVLYTAMHLRAGVKEWFMLWLEREHPELVGRYVQLYGKGAYAPKEYRKWLAAKIKPLITAHGLERGREDPLTGGVRSTALGSTRTAEGERVKFRTGRSLIAEELPPSELGRAAIEAQPTLF